MCIGGRRFITPILCCSVQRLSETILYFHEFFFLTQVSEALDLVGRVSSVAPLIPELVARLHALKELHERASQFAGSVAYMSDSQQQVSKQVNELQKLLTKVCNKLFDNHYFYQ